jgi:membrane dipeptidase
MPSAIERSLDKALSLLQPTPAQLERGLELHRQSIVVDAYGFAPCTSPSDLVSDMRGAAESGLSRPELEQRLYALQVTGKVRDAAARRDGRHAPDATGIE